MKVFKSKHNDLEIHYYEYAQFIRASMVTDSIGLSNCLVYVVCNKYSKMSKSKDGVLTLEPQLKFLIEHLIHKRPGELIFLPYHKQDIDYLHYYYIFQCADLNTLGFVPDDIRTSLTGCLDKIDKKRIV